MMNRPFTVQLANAACNTQAALAYFSNHHRWSTQSVSGIHHEYAARDLGGLGHGLHQQLADALHKNLEYLFNSTKSNGLCISQAPITDWQMLTEMTILICI